MSSADQPLGGDASRGYKAWFLALLLGVLACNYVDRLALGLMLQDIKTDLALSDTQLGVLSGIAFALFYSLMGIPIARWADRGNRATIIAATTGLWSLAVALCGFAGNFVQLLLIRVGVAVGEAGCMPPAHSLIADHFTRAERPRAVAIYTMGWPLSIFIGYFVAGWLNELYGWRVTFMLIALPGLVLAPLAKLTLREPRVSGSRAAVAPDSNAHPGAREVFQTLIRNRTFRHVLACLSIAYFFGYGILQWQPAFFIRSFGLETGALGTWLAVISGGAGLIGIYWGGELAARRAANNERLQLKATGCAYISFSVLSSLVYLSTDYRWSFACLALATLGLNAANGPMFATLQTLVPERMRAVSIAIIFLFANLIGMGLGPLAAGALSDALQPRFGNEALRYALLILSPGYLWGAWHLWRASHTVAADLKLVDAEHHEAGSAGAVR